MSSVSVEAKVAEACIRGSEDAWSNIFGFSDDPHERIYPEYLLTMAIAHRFARVFRGEVRLEQPTKTVGFRTRTSNLRYRLTRAGKVDIVVFRCLRPDGNIYVEIKRFVRGFADIKDDVARCCELVRAGCPRKQHLAATSCFLDISNEVERTCQDYAMARQKRGLRRKLAAFVSDHGCGATYHDKKLGQLVFASSSAANESDETGMPAYMRDEYYRRDVFVVVISGSNAKQSTSSGLGK